MSVRTPTTVPPEPVTDQEQRAIGLAVAEWDREAIRGLACVYNLPSSAEDSIRCEAPVPSLSNNVYHIYRPRTGAEWVYQELRCLHCGNHLFPAVPRGVNQ